MCRRVRGGGGGGGVQGVPVSALAPRLPAIFMSSLGISVLPGLGPPPPLQPPSSSSSSYSACSVKQLLARPGFKHVNSGGCAKAICRGLGFLGSDATVEDIFSGLKFKFHELHFHDSFSTKKKQYLNDAKCSNKHSEALTA